MSFPALFDAIAEVHPEMAQALREMFRVHAEDIRKQIIAEINIARQEGEWDIRSVRTRIERMKIE